MRSYPLLAISGGGSNGAFGAGFLCGWTESGTRPDFKVVTAVSTGSLQAPLAFLGPDYDHILRAIFTTHGTEEIYQRKRPLEVIQKEAGTVFIPRGIDVIALDMDKLWSFTPVNNYTVGSIISGGDVFGMVQENELIQHSIMLFPRKQGRITWIAPAGNYNLKQDVIEIETPNGAKELEIISFTTIHERFEEG